MWYYLHRLDSFASGYIEGMSLTDWGVALAAVVLIGAVCMQGYGSRRNY